MNVKTMVIEAYEAPEVKVIEIEIEKGFAASVEPLGERYEEMGW